MTKLIAIFSLTLVAAVSALAQNQLDFLSDLSQYQDIREMLPRYLLKQADALLAERHKAVAKLATLQQVAERRAYIRAKMAAAVGGFPERTPLNARVVGMLDRGGYTIE